MKVTRIMSPPVTIDAKEKVVDVFRRVMDPKDALSRKRLIVIKDGKAIGVVERTALFEGASHADPEITIEQVCSKNFLTVSPDEFGYEAMRIMTQNDAAFVVVVGKDGKPAGYISRGDLIQAQKEKTAEDTIVEEGWLQKLLGRTGETIIPEG
jgi:signal-transduction protein with cAMP-binding, CBS, and nucleotidyltransferase domain